jgi:hypothetical protein
MNWLQRLFVRIAAWIAPPLGRLLNSAGGTVERLAEQNYYLRQRYDDQRQSILQEIADYREALAMAGGGWQPRQIAGHVTDYTAQRESDTTAVVACKERLAELELALEDRGWKRQLALAETEFSRYGIQQIILISRLYFIKNPLIKRGVKVSSYYVFGRGVEISATDETANEVLQGFFSDPRNAKEISHTGLVDKEEARHTDGNIFWVFFAAVDDGQVQVRHIDALEIEDIITNSDDSSEPWFYHRRWTQMQFDPKSGIQTPSVKDGWYVAMGYDPPAGLKEIKGSPIMRDAAGNITPVIHIKGDSLSKWRFACPIVYAALDWARAYRHFLEDWATITRQLARFSWQVETQGGIPAIAAFKQTLATTLGNDGTNIETNPPPVTGSAWITGPGNKLSAIRTAGATTEPEQGRRVMLMVAAAFGLPETFFGDASTGSLATAQSLDRPTELKFLETQELWREVLQRVGRFVLDQSSRAPKGRLREARKSANASKVPATADITIDVKFPSILEHDITSRVAAIVEALTLNGFEATGIDEKTGVGLLLEELGVEDVQAVLEVMYPDKASGDSQGYDPDRTKLPPEPPPGTPGAPPAAGEPGAGAPPVAPKPRTAHPKRTGGTQTSEAVVARAVGELRKALVKLQEKGR